MKANDLRIGNLLMWNDPSEDIIRVDSIRVNRHSIAAIDYSELSRDERGFSQLDEFDPIPLTSEWLEKAGFQFRDNAWQKKVKYENGTGTYIVARVYPSGGFQLQLGAGFGVVCEYVHRLQNLIYETYFHELTLSEGNINQKT